MCDRYLSPPQFDTFITSEASGTEMECVQKIWKMVIDEVIGDTQVFIKELMSVVNWRLCEKFIDDEHDDEEEYITDPERLKTIEFTKEELCDVLEAAFCQDKHHKLSIERVMV